MCTAVLVVRGIREQNVIYPLNDNTIKRLVPLCHRDRHTRKILYNRICRSIIDERKSVGTINGRDPRTCDVDGFGMQNPPMHARPPVFRTCRGEINTSFSFGLNFFQLRVH